MPSILFTNLYLAARTGSELHTLELAKFFKGRGWDVTCYTLLYAYPLRREFEQEGINVVKLGEEDRLADHYDVLFAQHRLVSERVWNIERIAFGEVVVSILGIVEKEEDPPSFFEQASGFVFVSEEARDVVAERYGIVDRKGYVLPNYATAPYFQVATSQESSDRLPHRIAVISNHPPQEVLDMVELAASRGIGVEVFGSATRSVEVSAELISNYDVVISIGRTAQCCFAAQTSFFCYDRFGGPGYITPENLRAHARYNFSGRSKPERLSAQELLERVVEGYPESVQNRGELREVARERYCSDVLFSRLEAFILSLPHLGSARKTTETCEGDGCQEYLSSVLPLFGTAQFFYARADDLDHPCSEERSVRIRYRYHSDIVFELPPEVGDCRIVRFDPDDSPCACRLIGTQGTPYNACEFVGGKEDLFATDDPIYFVEPCTRLSFVASPCPYSQVAAYIKSLEGEVKRLRGRDEARDPTLAGRLKSLLVRSVTRACT